MSRADRRVPMMRRDGDPSPTSRKKKRPDLTATGLDAPARCSSCGRPIGFVEGADVLPSFCTACSTRS